VSALPPPPPSDPYRPGAAGPYGYVTPSPRPLQALPGLATAASVLVGIAGVCALAASGAFASRARLVDRLGVDSAFETGDDFPTLGEIDAADGRVVVTGILLSLAVIAAGVVFIIWQFRHARNAQMLAGSQGLSDPGWAIGGWFIPCANFVLPGIQLWTSSKASDPALPAGSHVGRGRGSPIVVWWAVVFGLGSALFTMGRVMFPTDQDIARDFRDFRFDTIDEATAADNTTAVGCFVMAIAAVLAILMIRSLTRRQADRVAALGGSGYGGGYGQSPGGGWGVPVRQAQPPGVPAPSPPPGTPSPGWGTPPAPPPPPGQPGGTPPASPPPSPGGWSPPAPGAP